MPIKVEQCRQFGVLTVAWIYWQVLTVAEQWSADIIETSWMYDIRLAVSIRSLHSAAQLKHRARPPPLNEIQPVRFSVQTRVMRDIKRRL